ncbi:MAG: hypothetical protein IJ196_05175 [Prevotella sp.]|nr:hypothetical protein [Prevotella sp.]
MLPRNTSPAIFNENVCVDMNSTAFSHGKHAEIRLEEVLKIQKKKDKPPTEGLSYFLQALLLPKITEEAPAHLKHIE